MRRLNADVDCTHTYAINTSIISYHAFRSVTLLISENIGGIYSTSILFKLFIYFKLIIFILNFHFYVITLVIPPLPSLYFSVPDCGLSLLLVGP